MVPTKIEKLLKIVSNGLSQKQLDVPKQRGVLAVRIRFFGGDRWGIACQDGVCKCGRGIEAGGGFQMDTKKLSVGPTNSGNRYVESWRRELCV